MTIPLLLNPVLSTDGGFKGSTAEKSVQRPEAPFRPATVPPARQMT